MDRLKGAGRSWDSKYDAAHYVDVQDNETIAGSVTLSDLPETQERYDTALRAANTDQYRIGYLPYAILVGWQQVRDDFAFWRVDNYDATHAATSTLRADAARSRSLDEMAVTYDIGLWSHYVADGSQPLHVSVHFDGWGDFPNPKNFTNSGQMHVMLDATFINKYINEAVVKPYLQAPTVTAPQKLISDSEAMQAITAYLSATLKQVVPVYELEKAGGFANGTPQAIQFTAARLAAGADELRDLVLWAWDDSLNQSVGYPQQRVRDILSGAPPPARTPGD